LSGPEAINSQKRSSSQPPTGESNLLDSEVEDYVAVYAHSTRTGFIPGKEEKKNQDTFFIQQNFANIANNWFFGVCDGHGVNGQFASDHVKQFLPTNIELLDYMLMRQREKEALKKPEEKKNEEGSGFFDDDEENLTSYLLSKDRRKKYTVISEGFIKTAVDIQNRSFNVDYSGTTVVTVML
jgi:serine/threonine protein phosphatase PrpC